MGTAKISGRFILRFIMQAYDQAYCMRKESHGKSSSRYLVIAGSRKVLQKLSSAAACCFVLLS